MGKAVERIFLPLMQLTLPEIVDVCLPPEAVFHNLMIVSIRKSYAGHARKVMNGIWAMGQAMFTKCIIVVDEDCDVQDLAEVTLRVANNIDPERDIQFTLGPVDSLDHASRLPNFGSKMGIDATRKWPAEGFTRPWPPMLKQDPDHHRKGRRHLEKTRHRIALLHHHSRRRDQVERNAVLRAPLMQRPARNHQHVALAHQDRLGPLGTRSMPLTRPSQVCAPFGVPPTSYSVEPSRICTT